MDDPGETLYDWEGEMASLDDELHESPAETLPDLDDLLRRMLEQSGYDLSDPVASEGEEREVVAEYLAAHETTLALERGTEGFTSGDAAAAINDFRELFDFLTATHGSADADLGGADAG